MKKILGIGNALVDILIRIEDEAILEALQLPKGSMTLVDINRSNQILEKLEGYPRSLAAGGSAANTIHGLGMLGAQTGYIGVIGNDAYGQSFEADMKHAGSEPFMVRSDTVTGRAVALITPDSERTFATCLGAAIELTASDLDILQPEPNKGVFSQYDVLHIEGYLVQNHELIERAVILAKQAGMKVSLDLASYNVVEEHLEFLQKLVTDHVDILFANEEEAEAFCGFQPKKALHHISDFCEIAIVKTGRSGSMVKSGEVVSEIDIIPAERLDTTGAGDLYASGFLYGLTRGWSLERCGYAGTLLAGNIIEEIGAKMNATRWNKIKKELSS
jgi:sugar/nucleoside kinase (ribokinase family)